MADKPESKLQKTTNPQNIPLLPLRDVVVYPHMVIPLFVGREKSILALDEAMSRDKQILLSAQKRADVDEPDLEDIHEFGTLADILQLLKLPDGTIKVLVEGGERARISNIVKSEDGFFSADADVIPVATDFDEKEMEVLVRSVISLFEQYVKLNKKLAPEILTSLGGIEDPSRLADTVAAHLTLKIDEKQKILEIEQSSERLEFLMSLMEAELDMLQVEKRIRGRVKQQMEKSQREYYLNCLLYTSPSPRD